MSSNAIRTIDSVSAGDVIPEATYTVDRARLVQYAGASLDRNPIHWDERFAKKVGLPDVIAHGMWTMGAAAESVAAWVGDPGRILEYGTRFSGMVVVPHDVPATLTVTGIVKSVDSESKQAVVELTATCADSRVLTKCQATVQLD